MKTEQERIEEYLKRFPLIPKKKPPKPVLVSEQELSAEALRKRHERARQALIDRERQEIAEHNRRVKAEAFQAYVDGWMEDRRRIEAHERWLRRQADPFNYGHWNNPDGDVA